MARKSYTPEYKAKLVIQVLRGEKELNEIAAEQGDQSQYAAEMADRVFGQRQPGLR